MSNEPATERDVDPQWIEWAECVPCTLAEMDPIAAVERDLLPTEVQDFTLMQWRGEVPGCAEMKTRYLLIVPRCLRSFRFHKDHNPCGCWVWVEELAEWRAL